MEDILRGKLVTSEVHVQREEHKPSNSVVQDEVRRSECAFELQSAHSLSLEN